MDFKSARIEGPTGEVFITPSQEGIFSIGEGFGEWDHPAITKLVRIHELPAEVVEEVQQTEDLSPLTPFVSEDSPGEFEFINGAQAELCEREDDSLLTASVGERQIGTITISDKLRETHPPKEAQFTRQPTPEETA
jgi:hypothetical protein